MIQDTSKTLKAEEYFKEYSEIEPTRLERGPYDTRLNHPDTKGIGTSIRNQGGLIETPCVVEKDDFAYGGDKERYRIITGNIRIAEAANEGHAKIYCKVYRKDMPEDLRYFTALSGNIHNHRLSAVELGAAILKACAMFRSTASELGAQLGVPDAKINKWLLAKQLADSLPEHPELSSFEEQDAYRMALIEEKVPQERKWEAIEATNGRAPKEVKQIVEEMLLGGGKAADIAEKIKKEQGRTVTMTIEVDEALDWLLQQEAAKAHIKRKALFVTKILREWAAQVQAQPVPN